MILYHHSWTYEFALTYEVRPMTSIYVSNVYTDWQEVFGILDRGISQPHL